MFKIDKLFLVYYCYSSVIPSDLEIINKESFTRNIFADMRYKRLRYHKYKFYRGMNMEYL